MQHLVKQHFNTTRTDRNLLNNHKSCVLWFTGLSGSGKSTIANEVEKQLFQQGKRVYTLDGDNIRLGINKGLGFTAEDRAENLRRIAEIAKLMVDAGIIVIATFVSPLKEDRALVEAIIGEEDFVEVFVNTPLEECEKRDVKGFYAKARKGEIKNFTGISAPYEAPEYPKINLPTLEKTPVELAQNVVEYLTNHKII